MSPLNNIMENDIPAVLKSRKLLGKVSSEVDSLKLKLNQAIKHNQQSSGNNQAQQKAKIDSLTKELQDASLRLVQVKVSVLDCSSSTLSGVWRTSVSDKWTGVSDKCAGPVCGAVCGTSARTGTPLHRHIGMSDEFA